MQEPPRVSSDESNRGWSDVGLSKDEERIDGSWHLSKKQNRRDLARITKVPVVARRRGFFRNEPRTR